MTITDSTARPGRTCPGGAHGCGCETCRSPQLDLSSVIATELRAAMEASLLAVPAGGTVVLLARQNPLRELDRALPSLGDGFEVRYYEACPVGWRVAVARRATDG